MFSFGWRSVILALLAACGTEGAGTRTFILRADVDPGDAYDVRITARIPAGWPEPHIAGDGAVSYSVSYDLGAPLPVVSLALAQEPGAAAARVAGVIDDQLYPADVEHVALARDRRWVTQRTPERVDASLFTPGPRDSVVICSLAGITAALEPVGRRLCEDLVVDEAAR